MDLDTGAGLLHRLTSYTPDAARAGGNPGAPVAIRQVSSRTVDPLTS